MIEVGAMRSVNCRDGFSLIELMVVLSIVTALATMTMAANQSFTYLVYQAEAKQNLKLIVVLFRSWRTENDASFSTSGWAFCGVTGSWTDCLLTHHDMSVSNCNFGNPLGFKMSDCKNNRYRYWVRNQGGISTTNFSAVAALKQGAFRDYPYTADEWDSNMCHELCHVKEITQNGIGPAVYNGLNCGYPSYTAYSACGF